MGDQNSVVAGPSVTIFVVFVSINLIYLIHLSLLTDVIRVNFFTSTPPINMFCPIWSVLILEQSLRSELFLGLNIFQWLQ